jgi:predicted alpha/beta superfamily hydrolase
VKKKSSQLIYITFLIFLIVSCTKEDIKLEGKTERFSINSQIINDTYPIEVYLPMNYDSSQPNLLIIGLDGELFFEETAGIISEKVSQGSMPPCVFIGVGNLKGRNRDYTPTAYEHGLGGAENFYRFLKEELIPEVAIRYNIKPTNEKILIGHSFGALFTHYAIFQNRADNPFNKFVSVGCSFWYDSGVIFEYEKNYFLNHTDLDARYYAGMGSLEGGVNLASFDEMNERLQNRNYPKFKMNTQIIKKHGHSGSTIIGFKQGIDYVFTN